MKRSIALFAAGGVLAAVALAPTIGVAAAIVRYASNADRVDGFHAVGSRASTSKRAGKLVATNGKGRLPNDIIREAPRAGDSERLDGLSSEAFVHQCGAGALRGYAVVREDVGADYERVDGFGTSHGGPAEVSGSACHLQAATARRLSTGVYRVNLGFFAPSGCPAAAPDVVTALVTVAGVRGERLMANYVPACEDSSGVIEVHVFDLNGVARDATFSVAMLDEGGIPIP